MTKEEVLLKRKAADDAGVYSDDEIYKAMDEYAKQQAIDFDIWKRENGYLIDPSGEHYLKIVIDGDFAHNEIVLVDNAYDEFIESQNK
jgi:hypothetical protein